MRGNIFLQRMRKEPDVAYRIFSEVSLASLTNANLGGGLGPSFSIQMKKTELPIMSNQRWLFLRV